MASENKSKKDILRMGESPKRILTSEEVKAEQRNLAVGRALGALNMSRTLENIKIGKWLYDNNLELNEIDFDTVSDMKAEKIELTLENFELQKEIQLKESDFPAVRLDNTIASLAEEKSAMENAISSSIDFSPATVDNSQISRNPFVAVASPITPLMRQAEVLCHELKEELSVNGMAILTVLAKTEAVTKEQVNTLARELVELVRARPYLSSDAATFPLGARAFKALTEQVFKFIQMLPRVICEAPSGSATFFTKTISPANKREVKEVSVPNIARLVQTRQSYS